MSGDERPGVRVRGSCAAGHVTDATAVGRRVTWEGQCSHDGCDLPVKAKRVPGDRVPPPQQPDADSGSTVTVVRVDDYAESSSDPDDAGGFAVDDATPAAELVDPPPPAEGDSAGLGDADPLDEHEQHESAWARWRAGRRAARSARRVAGYRHPLGL